MTRILAAALLAAILLPNLALGQGLTPRQSEILSTTLAADGWLTPDDHADFWADFPGSMLEDDAGMDLFTEVVTAAASVSVKLQKETWTSAKLSLEAGRVVTTPEYEKAKESALAVSDVEEYRRRVSASLANADRMIEAAASGAPLPTANGPLYLTEELIDEVLSGIDGSIHRLQKLASHEWAWTPVEDHYPDAHVTILWDGPFKGSVVDTPLPSGQNVRAVDLKYQLTDSEFVQVTFIELAGAWEDPKYAVRQTIQATLAPLSGNALTSVPGEWRGHVSAHATGIFNSDNGPFMASARVVSAPEHDGAWLIMAASRDSRQNAVRLREGLERAMRPDR